MNIPEDAATEEDRMYEGALNAVFNIEKKDYPSYIGGLKVASGRSFDVVSPIDRTIVFGRFQEPEEGLTDKAVEAAAKAMFLGLRPVLRRGRGILRRPSTSSGSRGTDWPAYLH